MKHQKSLSITQRTLACGLLGLSLLWENCRREQPEPDLPCDCKQMPITQNLPGAKGKLFYPKNGVETYRIQIFHDGYPNLRLTRAVCTDSSFVRQVLSKQLPDSSMVQFTGGFVNGIVCFPGTSIDITDTPPPLRVLTVDKL